MFLTKCRREMGWGMWEGSIVGKTIRLNDWDGGRPYLHSLLINVFECIIVHVRPLEDISSREQTKEIVMERWKEWEKLLTLLH
jgi:hypothetical protein